MAFNVFGVVEKTKTGAYLYLTFSHSTVGETTLKWKEGISIHHMKTSFLKNLLRYNAIGTFAGNGYKESEINKINKRGVQNRLTLRHCYPDGETAIIC